MSAPLPPSPETQAIGCSIVLDDFQLDYMRVSRNELLASYMAREVAAFLRGFLEDHPEYLKETPAPYGKTFSLILHVVPPSPP